MEISVFVYIFVILEISFGCSTVLFINFKHYSGWFFSVMLMGSGTLGGLGASTYLKSKIHISYFHGHTLAKEDLKYIQNNLQPALGSANISICHEKWSVLDKFKKRTKDCILTHILLFIWSSPRYLDCFNQHAT